MKNSQSKNFSQVSDAHPIKIALENFKEDEICPIFSIDLKPFAFEDLLSYITDTFHADNETCKELADIVCANTNRNPFFVGKIIKKISVGLFSEYFLRSIFECVGQ